MEHTRTEAPTGGRSGVLPASPARGEHVLEEELPGRDAVGSSVSGGSGTVPVPDRRLPRRHSVRGQVLSALRRALVTGELVAGQVYSAPALAERHGVSPTPVREAMQQLTGEGLVETVPNRGFRVVEHSARDDAELAEVRLLLELPVVLRLGLTRPPRTWQVLHPLAGRTVAAAARGDRAAYADADRAFHRALLEPAGNLRLAEFAEDVQRRAPVPPAVPGTSLVSAAAEHVALVEALLQRDLPAAERILRAHLAPGVPCTPPAAHLAGLAPATPAAADSTEAAPAPG
ncbi:hypothetical protein N566_14180, partial [Streptomycetaceae bacterium MP113-05]